MLRRVALRLPHLPKQNAKICGFVCIIRQNVNSHQARPPRHPLRSTPIAVAMFLQRSAVTAARRVAPRAIARRTFTTTFVRRRSLQQLSYDLPLTCLQAMRTTSLPRKRRPASPATLPVSSRATRSLTVCCANLDVFAAEQQPAAAIATTSFADNHNYRDQD